MDERVFSPSQPKMDTHIYDTYEKEFKTLFEQIQRDLQNLRISTDKKLIQSKINRSLEEADEIVMLVY